MKKESVIVGMSGGVDSSIAAYLLKEQGYDVAGLFMKNWEEDDTDTYCAASVDVEDAQKVCDKLGIPLHRANFAAEYWDNVFSHCLDVFKQGYTPNPDILCNKEIKFKCFLEYAEHLGADYIATGHYVRKGFVDGEYQLLKGLDDNKDQSYFLYTLGQKQLAKSLFPVGEITKPEVRAIAKQLGFDNHDKKDSTGICFIGERKFKDFLKRYLPAQPGEIVSLEDKVLGRHEGLMYYTLGQRQGLGIGGHKDYPEAPWFVVKKDMDKNQLVVCQNTDNPALFCSSLTCRLGHWVSEQDKPEEAFDCHAKVRYRQSDQSCHVKHLHDETYQVTFAEPQRAVTPGQSIVLYADNAVLGGGIIEAEPDTST